LKNDVKHFEIFPCVVGRYLSSMNITPKKNDLYKYFLGVGRISLLFSIISLPLGIRTLFFLHLIIYKCLGSFKIFLALYNG
jgi:hypothetical protein